MIAALPLVAAGSSAHAARKGSFGEAEVQALARDLARRAFTPPSKDLPQTLAKLDYDAYRDIRFDPAQALWKAQGLPFQLQFFHRGGLFRERVDLYELRDGQPTPIAYSTEQFNFKRGAPRPWLFVAHCADAGVWKSWALGDRRYNRSTFAYADVVTRFLSPNTAKASANSSSDAASARNLNQRGRSRSAR